MARLRTFRVASALAVFGYLFGGAAVLAEPQPIAELMLHREVSQPKWFPDRQPLFGDYLASGDGEASRALSGRVFWDLYENQSQDDRHPAFFRGFLESGGRRYPFEIIGVYTPESADQQRWRISGVVTFADKALLGAAAEPFTGTFDASTSTSRFTIWAEQPE